MTQSGVLTRGYGFGDYRLFPDLQLLCRDHKAVHLSPTAMRVLIALVEHHGQSVSKDYLLKQVWFGSSIGESNLPIQIAALRKLLGPGAIRTLYGIGYEFIPAVVTFDGGGAARIPPAPDEAGTVLHTNLPRPLDTVIGREADMVELREAVKQHRLVTIAGPGGVGKTRLAIEFGWRLAGDFPDGVWLVDLAPLNDAEVIASTTATVLGVAQRAAQTLLEAIAATIVRKRLLLIFDNCEYLAADAAALIVALLNRAPGLSVLVTSQEFLGVVGEQIHRLEPLAVPRSGAVEIAGFAAIDLFVERACSSIRHFRLNTDNAPSIAAICRGLDGMPLALEMAAALLPLLGLDGLRARLDEQLNLFLTGPRANDPRRGTLRAVVEWSHGLLEDAEQQLFRRLAVFAGSFSLDAVVAVAGPAGTEPWVIVEILGRLLDKSLVTAQPGETPRYRLLETLRLYAVEQLAASGEGVAIAERHARYFTLLFEGSDQVWETRSDREWRARYGPEIDNVRAALTWARAAPERTTIGTALAGSAARLWFMLDLVVEGRRYADCFVDLIDSATPHAVAGRLLRFAGNMWRTQRARCVAFREGSVAHFRLSEDRLQVGILLGLLGQDYVLLGRQADAEAALAEARAILTGSDRLKSLAEVMTLSSGVAVMRQDTTQAALYCVAAGDLARQIKDETRESRSLVNMGEVEFLRGAIDRAIDYAREAAASFRRADEPYHLASILLNLASYLALRGDHGEARSSAREAFTTLIAEGGYFLRVCLQSWALIGALESHSTAAARLIGWVDAEFERAGEIREPTERAVRDRLRALLERALSAREIATLAAEGAGWSESEAAAFVLDGLVSADPERAALTVEHGYDEKK
jgi:predicted ATPase/DNA-binding winged helix-turn-helix (wHTH) protein